MVRISRPAAFLAAVVTLAPLPVLAAASSLPDLFPTSKTLAQLLADGWTVTNGQFGVEIRGVVIFLTKGRDFAYCVASDTNPKTNQKSTDGLYSSCVSTMRQ